MGVNFARNPMESLALASRVRRKVSKSFRFSVTISLSDGIRGRTGVGVP